MIKIKRTLKMDLEFQGENLFKLLISKFCTEKSAVFEKGTQNLSSEQAQMDIFLPGFLPRKAIKTKIQLTLEEFRKISQAFVMEVKEHNELLFKGVMEEIMNLCPERKMIILKRARNFLEKVTKETTDMIDKIIQCEKSMMWTDEKSSQGFDLNCTTRLDNNPNNSNNTSHLYF